MAIAAEVKTTPHVEPGGVFSWALIVATVLPFCTFGATPYLAGAAQVAAALIIIAATHVAATAYLLTDAQVRAFCVTHPVKMIAMPLGLIAGALVLFSLVSGAAATACLAPFFTYQAWHFGVQNIGVSTFISLKERGHPLARSDKILIKCGVAAGVLGVLRSMSAVFPVTELGATASSMVDAAYFCGSLAAAGLVVAALWRAVQIARQGHLLSATAVGLSVCFLFPMYVTHDYMLGYVSFSVAHGLQYLIFLTTHSIGSNRAAELSQRRVGLLGPAVLLGMVVVGSLVWNTELVKTLPTIGVAIIPALTLAHFWVDLFLWRMRDKNRAEWVKSRFGFVLK